MSYYDMALDAGYRGEEARQMAEYIEQGEREAYERHLEEQRQLDERQGLLHALADATDADLLGELVRRGVLFRQVDRRSVWPTGDRVVMECFTSNWEPVAGGVS